MAKYDPAFLKEVLAADEFDILVPEFVARASKGFASAGDSVTSCQERTQKMTIETASMLGNQGIGHADPVFAMILTAQAETMQAQAAMWTGLSKMNTALERVITRM